MARAVARLSALAISKARARGRYADGGGLYFQVSATGTRSWIYRFTVNGRVREMGLGPFPAISLAAARAKVTECRKLRWEGADPIDARKVTRNKARLEAARSVTFKVCAERYFEAHKSALKPGKYARQWLSELERYAYPIFGSRSVEAVDVAAVMRVLDPIWATKTETANRVRSKTERVLDWAKVHGYRTGDNPARWKGHLENLLPKKSKIRGVKHHSALPYTEIGGFMGSVRAQRGVAARALEFLILTATRTSETILARWAEFDLAQGIWTIPGERMKMGRAHRIPLSEPALAVLREMGKVRVSEYVFPGAHRDQPLSNMAFLSLLHRMGRFDITTHGFRSTFRDWAAEQTRHDRETAEMALAHAVESKVEAAYRRGDLFMKRKGLMEDWARYCEMAAEPTGVAILLARIG